MKEEEWKKYFKSLLKGNENRTEVETSERKGEEGRSRGSRKRRNYEGDKEIK